MEGRTISPLAYMQAGAELRKMGVIEEPGTLAALSSAFVHYLYFMEKRALQCKANNTLPFPLTWEGFRIFAGVTEAEYADLTGPPEGARLHSLISDCINGQQKEGAILGVYPVKAVQLANDIKDKVELSGGLAIEQITGLEVK